MPGAKISWQLIVKVRKQTITLTGTEIDERDTRIGGVRDTLVPLNKYLLKISLIMHITYY